MTRFASIVLIPLVAVVWVFPPPALVKKSAVKVEGEGQETKASKLTKNPSQLHLDLDLLIARPENALYVQEQLLHTDGPFPSWVAKTLADDFLQYDAASLPVLLMMTVVACTQLLNYYREHVELMNLDAVIGTRITEGVCVCVCVQSVIHR